MSNRIHSQTYEYSYASTRFANARFINFNEMRSMKSHPVHQQY